MPTPATRPVLNALATGATWLSLASPSWAGGAAYANDGFEGGAYTARVPVYKLRFPGATVSLNCNGEPRA